MDQILGQMVKAKLYRENLTQKHTHIHSQKRKRGKNNISCSQSPPPQFGMIRYLFRYSTGAGTSSCLWSFNALLLRLLGEISLSLLCSHSSRFSALDLDPPLRVDTLRASVLRSHRTGLKEQLTRCLWLTQTRGREGSRFGASLRRQRQAWRCSRLRRAVRSPGEVVPGSREPGSGGLHRLPGGEVWRVTCACSQASWWLQQQP